MYLEAAHWSKEQVAQMRAHFLDNVAGHVLTVTHDVELYRRIVLGVPGSSFYRYEVVTWPGHVAIAGDMGSYVFERIDDMFEFFRGRTAGEYLDLSYLAGKCEAADKHAGLSEWVGEARSLDALAEILRESMDPDDGFAPTQADRIVAEWRKRVADDYGEMSSVDDVRELADCYRPDPDWPRDPFADLWDRGRMFYEWSHHFAWCIFAIAFAVDKYDEHKQQQLVVEAARLGVVPGAGV